MPLQLVEFSCCVDKSKFIEEFILTPNEAMYFKFYPLEHDFILIKDSDRVILRSMVCRTSHLGISYFGLFNFDLTSQYKDDSLKLFLDYVKKWNQSRSLTKIIGPINFSTWLPYRLLCYSDGGPEFSFEPNFPILYSTKLKQIGFKTHKTYSSKGFGPISKFIEGSQSDYDNAIAQGFTFEFFPAKLEEDHIEELFRLSNIGFEKNYLATPIDLATFKSLYKIGSGVSDYSNSNLVKSNSGEVIGFFISFIENNYVVCKTVAINPSFRGFGLSNALFFQALSKAQSSGVSAMVSAMVIEGAQSESYGKKMELKWTHLYEILEYLT